MLLHRKKPSSAPSSSSSAAAANPDAAVQRRRRPAPALPPSLCGPRPSSSAGKGFGADPADDDTASTCTSSTAGTAAVPPPSPPVPRRRANPSPNRARSVEPGRSRRAGGGGGGARPPTAAATTTTSAVRPGPRRRRPSSLQPAGRTRRSKKEAHDGRNAPSGSGGTASANDADATPPVGRRISAADPRGSSGAAPPRKGDGAGPTSGGGGGGGGPTTPPTEAPTLAASPPSNRRPGRGGPPPTTTATTTTTTTTKAESLRPTAAVAAPPRPRKVGGGGGGGGVGVGGPTHRIGKKVPPAVDAESPHHHHRAAAAAAGGDGGRQSSSGVGGTGTLGGAPRPPPRRVGASFRDLYVIARQIDSGSFSTVYEATHRHTHDGRRFAVKVIDRRHLSPQSDGAVFREAKILQHLNNGANANANGNGGGAGGRRRGQGQGTQGRGRRRQSRGGESARHTAADAGAANRGKVREEEEEEKEKEDEEEEEGEVSELENHHGGIINLVDFHVEPARFYLVMDYMAGGAVFDRVLDRRHYSEDQARRFASNLLAAVAYMHGQNVVHRDLKPQNLLLGSVDDDADVRIADFGFATTIRPRGVDELGRPNRRVLKAKCGTPSYVAPEVLSGRPYDQSADMWSVGVVMYFVAGGYPPFVDYRSRAGLFRQIASGDYTFHETDWGDVSDGAKDFISALLTVDPGARITAEEALAHPWLREGPRKGTTKTARRGSQEGGVVNRPMQQHAAAKPERTSRVREARRKVLGAFRASKQ